MPAPRIGIFVATMTGLAQLCADEIASVLSREGLVNSIILMETALRADLDALDLIIVVSSTYGHGDIPDNGQAFFSALESCDSLVGKSFCVFGLGDRTYADTFCHAGEKWDALLETKNAHRLAPLKRHDASSATLAEDVAAEWAAGILSELASAACCS